jgi:hypothetical protein
MIIVMGIVSSCVGTQESAMCDLVAATNIETYYPSWNCTNGVPVSSVCSWTGVECDSNELVVVISLASIGLTGTIPSTIGYLTNMWHLKPMDNSFTGTIPSTIGYLTNMELLYLHRNSFTGTIPSSIGYLANMKLLYLHYNSFTGTIPSSIGYLTSMYQLLLDRNSFTGTIPSTIGHLINKELLDLIDNSYSGTIPSTIGYLTALYALYLSDNSFTGSIPSTLCLINTFYVYDLYLGGNNFACYPSCLDASPFYRGDYDNYPVCNGQSYCEFAD